ncbi:hypothetical protein FB45DRAFT_997578 [Roridomyces roridus]|uniref:Uncharacterized protein n=1 Tax=Roridomyces roridus TaxID=1738132 RepID=A0AAD7CK12_9AGAR|nr:hypothetical protein FB45DRAFT_997578 [Roridomyces roridus]
MGCKPPRTLEKAPRRRQKHLIGIPRLELGEVEKPVFRASLNRYKYCPSASGSWDNRKTEKPKNRDSGDGGVLPSGTNTSDHLLTPDSLDDTRPVVSACARAYPPDARPLSPARRTRRPSSSLHRENGRRSDGIIIEAAIFQDPQAHDSHWKIGGTIAGLREELGRIETVMARLTRTPLPSPALSPPVGVLNLQLPPFGCLTPLTVDTTYSVTLF